MPTPKFFRNFSSKGSSDDSPDATPTTRTKGIHPEAEIANPDVPQYSDAMKEAWSAAHAELPQAKGVEKFLNGIEKVQNALIPSDGEQAVIDTLAVPVKALASTAQMAEVIEKGVNTFMEAVPALMNALDEVAKIHPFISVAVLAFKAVYTLEVKRRSNDKRVIALYVEMKDMMAVLVQLKDVADPTKMGPDGQSIEGRMQKLCAGVAEDIKRCANTCDTYLKKKILVKIFAGPIWEGRLLEFVETFTKRRKDFEFALTIHTAVGVDEANLKLSTVDERTAELNQKMEAMMDMFQKFVTPEQRQLAFLVEQKGGDAIIDNEQVMKELSEAEASLSAPAGVERHRSTKKFDLVEIQHEIRDDPAVAIGKNAEFFSRKFDIQRRQIQEDIERAVSREGDRIILAVTAGPHERVLDPDIYEIWKDMGWRGSVKARHFVLALKDYYSDMVAGGDDEGIPASERWALQYIGVNYVRNILEAFDDDVSGFVTVKEANDFTRSRPLDWSLPHWLAYWAIGWQTTSTSYCEKIEEIFDAMIRLSDGVLPENRKEVNEYVSYVWEEVIVYVRSFRWENGTENLREKFQSYVDAEEARLQKNLEDIKYHIDSDEAVRLISGHGRIETTLFPMFYLVLKRDLQKISLARKHVLTDSELPDAVDTVQWIINAAFYRVSDLRAIFEQQSLAPKEQFAIFAKGLYSIASGDGIFHGDRLRTLPDPIPARDEIIPDPDSIPLSVLRYPTGDRHENDLAAYDSPIPMISPPIDGPDAILGTYYGFIYEYEEPAGPMIKWTLNRGGERNSIVASGTHYYAGYHKMYTITGTTGPLEGGKMLVDLMAVYAFTFPNINLTGYFDLEENSLKGTLTMSDGTKGEFVFKRHPDFVRWYPAPSIIDADERWKFATTAVLDRIRRESWSPSYILKRIKDRKRYVELAIRDEYYGKELNGDEFDEYMALFPSMYESDARFYASLINVELSKVPIHPIDCDSCDATPGGARILCMDCHDKTTVDLCSEPECLDAVITLERRPDLKAPHTPNHSMLKVHRILFSRDTARTERNAKDALEAARQTLSELKLKKKPMPKCIHCQNVVSLPCWYCVDCTGEKFICADCEGKCLAFNETHTRKHTLVRVIQKVEESKVSAEERLKAVEGHLESVQDELSKMRQLFSRLFEKGAEGSPSDPLTKADVLDAAKTEPSLVGPLSARGGDEHGTEDEDRSAQGEDDLDDDEDDEGESSTDEDKDRD